MDHQQPDSSTLLLEEIQRLQTFCLMILAAVALGFALYWLKPVVIPFIVAVFLTYSLLPVIDFLQRRLRVNKWVSLGVTSLLGVLVIYLLAAFLVSTVNNVQENQAVYGEQFRVLIENFSDKVPWDQLEQVGLERERLSPQRIFDEAVAATGGAAARDIAANLFGELMNLVSNALLVLIFMMFLLIGRVARKAEIITNTTFDEMEFSVKRYISLKVVISVFTGLAHGLVLTAFDVKFAFVFGFLAFLLNFIPSIGPIIAVIITIPALPLTPDMSLTIALLVIAAIGTVQFVSGNVVEPRLMGDLLDLHPITVLLGLMFFGMLWGVIGMFLATPLIAVIKILLSKTEVTTPVANALAGRFDEKVKVDPIGPADGNPAPDGPERPPALAPLAQESDDSGSPETAAPQEDSKNS